MERLETHRERGATMIEYALLVSLIAMTYPLDDGHTATVSHPTP